MTETPKFPEPSPASGAIDAVCPTIQAMPVSKFANASEPHLFAGNPRALGPVPFSTTLPNGYSRVDCHFIRLYNPLRERQLAGFADAWAPTCDLITTRDEDNWMPRSPQTQTELSARITVLEEIVAMVFEIEAIRSAMHNPLMRRAQVVTAQRDQATTPSRRALDTAWADAFIRLGIKAA